MSNRSALFVLALALALTLPGYLAAQPAPGTTETEVEVEVEEDGDTEVEVETETQTDAEEGDEDDSRESAHGSYEWQWSWGAGFEYGFFITELQRWNTHLLEPNGAKEFDADFMGVTDLAIEVSPVEALRLTLFGGVATLYDKDPSLLAWYVGLEPALAIRRGIFELAAGVGVGGGKIELSLDSGEENDAALLMVRPFIEPRIYPTDWMAIYLRLGFNLFAVYGLEGDLALPEANNEPIESDNLSEAGLYTSLGFRFGSYPDHVKDIPDTDGDGLRDDVDDCPAEAEDVDNYLDDDGCPEADNDGDGIVDTADSCPMDPEDLDGWMDDDGCPETDDDTDGDGILNPVDQCPGDPEDFDQFQDDDGCPEADNDGDGILDVDDDCPLEPGVPQKKGCPFKLVEVTEKAIKINDKIFFELDKAVIKPESYPLLDEVAQVIIDNPRIKLIEIGGHTDTAGKDKYNLELSQSRADSVREYLVGKGVEPERLTARGYGETRLLVPTPDGEKETPEAAAKNRRVEFNILEQDEVKKIMREDKVPEQGVEDVDPVNP